MSKQLKALVTLTLDGINASRSIDVGWKSDRELTDLEDQELFLLSEAIRTALIHEKGALHEMVKEAADTKRKLS